MKKLSSFLVLMLIALMLFVSCNGSTPTKEDSNSSSNGSTPTVTERAATDADYELFFNIIYANEVLSGLIRTGNIPSTSYKIVDENNVEFYGCSFNSYSTNGSTLPVTLYGNMYIKTRTEESSTEYIKINLTEGTKIGGIDYTVDAEYTNGSSGFNFTNVVVNGITVKGLGDLLMNSLVRTATSEDVVLIQKILEAFDYVIDNPQNFTNPETLRVEGTHYEFTNLAVDTSNTNYILNGILDTTIGITDKSYSCLLEPNTKIAGENHIIKFYISVSTDGDGNKTYSANNIMIDSHAIRGLQEALNAASTN